MKLLVQTWDFLFGVLLIGGAPWAALGLPIIFFDSLQSLFHFHLPVAVGLVVSFIVWIMALIVFGWAIWFRARHRKLPLGFLPLELIFGVACGVVFFFVYGLLVHSTID